MKKNLIYIFLATGCLSLTSCSDDDITPSIDISPEYETALTLNENSIHADTLIYEWYHKYNTAILYKFKDTDLSWLWASKLSNYYVKFDITNKEDSTAVEDMVDKLKNQFFANYSDAFLAENLPYKIMLTKELHTSSSTTSAYTNAISNNQDAMIIGYMKSESGTYSAANFKENVGTVFTQLFFGVLDPKPVEFLNSIVACALNMTTMPLKPGGTTWRDTDPEIEAEQKTYPDFVNQDVTSERQLHSTNVIGYIKGGKSPVTVPSQGQDYADYLDFIANNPGSYIRQRTQYYWRIAKRASLLIEYQKTYRNEDLIAKQNEKYPDDKVTLEDFSYTEK